MNVQIFYSFMLNFKNLVFEGFYFEHFKFKDPVVQCCTRVVLQLTSNFSYLRKWAEHYTALEHYYNIEECTILTQEG